MGPLINMKCLIDQNILVQPVSIILSLCFDVELPMSLLVLPSIFFTLINNFAKIHAVPCSQLFYAFYSLHDQVTQDFNYDIKLSHLTSFQKYIDVIISGLQLNGETGVSGRLYRVPQCF